MELLRVEVVGITGGRNVGTINRVASPRVVLNLRLCNQVLPHWFFSFPFPFDVSFTHGDVILSLIFIICCSFMIRVSYCLRGRGGRDRLCTRCLCYLFAGIF